ncbi:transglycosylase SLT domain-containing protein [Swingsia samuiensis]|uniref:Lytic transglycosylase domain-containing protein n=1 Tax=Swingsia samuiensis TaxID=1293412 RepID=A0A4Y6UMH3_9PROT|nr:transglycosylase SLT domain-containing protein [Swingsia samuiensis]QDH17878.1 lytic transglycosylase domain-containing protein [Swingsia samuiensis]
MLRTFFLLSILICLGGYSKDARSEDGLCSVPISQAEYQFNIPHNLLQSVALIESGRTTSRLGKREAWPWTVNAEGKGYFFNSKNEAIQAVREFIQEGIVSIDVGCMQINLHQHPDAFRSLENAFDPYLNAQYGGEFLHQLFGKTHSWLQAVGAYHSLTPQLGAEYRQHVFALWSGVEDNYRPPDFLPQVVMTSMGPKVIFPNTFEKYNSFNSKSGKHEKEVLLQASTLIKNIKKPVETSKFRYSDNIKEGKTLSSYRLNPIHDNWRGNNFY